VGRADRAQFLWIKWEIQLNPLDQIQQQHGHRAEQEHRDGVLSPPHLAMFINSGEPVYQPLNWAEDGIKERPLTTENLGHENAERLSDSEDKQEENCDL
jgi:hypothetical protein